MSEAKAWVRHHLGNEYVVVVMHLGNTQWGATAHHLLSVDGGRLTFEQGWIGSYEVCDDLDAAMRKAEQLVRDRAPHDCGAGKCSEWQGST